MEKDLKQALTQLRESERLADELRNLLTTLRNDLQTLRAGSWAEESKVTLDIMDRQMSHLNRLLDHLPGGATKCD
jgi:hypothetical protein